MNVPPELLGFLVNTKRLIDLLMEGLSRSAIAETLGEADTKMLFFKNETLF